MSLSCYVDMAMTGSASCRDNVLGSSLQHGRNLVPTTFRTLVFGGFLTHLAELWS